MALNSELKSRRVAAGLTQQALAARIGIDRATISHVEKGRRAPSVAVLEGWVRETGGAPVVFDGPALETQESTAERLLNMRTAVGLSQATLASKLGCDASMISRMETGKSTVTTVQYAAWTAACRETVEAHQVPGARILALRTKAGFTQAELAHAVGVEQGAISKMETGARGVSAATFEAIEEVCNASAAARTSGPSAQKPRDTAGGHSQFDGSVARWTGNLSDTGMAAAYVRDLLSLVQDAVAELWGSEATQDRTLVLAVFDRMIADRDRRIAERAQ